ncbi:MAG: flagellar motor protein MotB [Nitrospina sp.]|jgi:chemotaxis protein MotB|nr:flagellar motor protein MotB [Nitrospina sp.]MBT3855275.1 flagellar motor protein MotB [Nitrospina sp.]MBT4105736.1 flagellar motor protein MotB [Nitrospina sp.]MBT4389683.1 flagellar motor protein MotB [Nitrospina sp.]MBT4622054.1 flagellar motor protein MotB [Nitrospina sp.]
MAEKKDPKKEKKAPEEEEEDEHECPQGAPSWVMTFADLVTLLMVFFILLFAMGSIEEEKWKQMKSSLKDALGQENIPEAGIREGLDVIKEKVLDETTIHAVDEVGAMVAKEVEEIASEVEEFVFKNKLAGKVEVSSDERGAIITLSDTVMFPPGKSRMTYTGDEIIKQVFDILKQFSYQVKIEGHTDNVPMNTAQYPSNWELSAARAAEVARKLVKAGFNPTNLSIEAFAQYRPKVPNDSRQGRATNRRIEIVYQRGSIRKHMVDILRR